VKQENIRNIAIIAHVDHGKTTLVDKLLRATDAFRENQKVEERVLDSNDQERERGITILAKNISIEYKGVKINVIDTPGHADFGGEVERILKMVNGVLLLVDAAEGPMPQTRFVLQKAIELGHRIIVVVNKIDRPDARVYEIGDEVLELLLELDASDDQLDSPVIFCSGRNGTASLSPDAPGEDLRPLFDMILSHIPAPEGDAEGPAQMLVSAVDYNDYVGKIAVGRIERGTFRLKQDICVCDFHSDVNRRSRITAMFQIDGLRRVPCEQASVGDIICVSGIEDINIGNTVCDVETAALCQDRRADDGDDLLGQQRAVRRHRGKICNHAPYPRLPVQRGDEGYVAARVGDRQRRFVQRRRPRRDAPVHTHGEYAARRV